MNNGVGGCCEGDGKSTSGSKTGWYHLQYYLLIRCISKHSCIALHGRHLGHVDPYSTKKQMTKLRQQNFRKMLRSNYMILRTQRLEG